MDEWSAHKKVKLLEIPKHKRTVLKLIPLKTSTYLRLWDKYVNAPFKKALCGQWENWFAQTVLQKPILKTIDFVEQAVSTLNKEIIKEHF